MQASVQNQRKTRLKLGTCGWSSFPAKELFGNWKEKFPSKLAAYATVFPVVEVNSTFYKLPRENTAKRWLEEARSSNPEFEFTVKANQVITHKDRFAGKPSLDAFSETQHTARILDAKIILLQTPASFRPSNQNISNLENFLENITWETLVWEPRGAWLDEGLSDLKRICKKFGITHCVDPFRNESVYGDFLYYRLHGLGKPSMYNYKFSDADLEWLSNKTRGKTGYVLFNNIWMGQDALRFLRYL